MLPEGRHADWASLADPPDVLWQPRACLKDVTTFQLGGPCLGIYHCARPDHCLSLLTQLKERDLPVLVLGGGSNCVISDAGLDAAVIRYAAGKQGIHKTADGVRVWGSTSLDALVEWSVKSGLAGLSALSGIPGTVGGAIAGNAGAFGRQIEDTLVWVDLWNGQTVSRVSAGELELAYRHSRLRSRGEIVLEAGFRLHPADRRVLQKEREEILALRREKHPDLKRVPCAGSFFRNLGPDARTQRRVAAGWILEQAGAKTFSYGGAAVFPKHANIIIKAKETCRAQDVYELSKRMEARVWEKFQIRLEREVKFIGPFEGAPYDPSVPLW